MNVTAKETVKLVPVWTSDPEDVIEQFDSPDAGLSSERVAELQAENGKNLLPESPPVTPLMLWVRQFKSLLVLLLLAACVLSFILGDMADAVAIAAVVLVNSLIGFLTELRATRSMEGLKKLTSETARVRRSGEPGLVPSEELVPGDRVILEAGDLVPADLRLLLGNVLQADESTLTGESAPVEKEVDPVPADAVLADRACMLHRGSRLTRGTGEGVVVAIGASSELGRISELIGQGGDQSTPLERKLDRLGHWLVWVTLGLIAGLAVLGFVLGLDQVLLLQTCVALAVAAIPEGLPVVATIALSRGLWRMAKRNAVISRLSAVETLGATGVICTDKTGTLTENRLHLEKIWLSGEDATKDVSTDLGESSRNLLLAAVLCNNAALKEDGDDPIGDPLEIALLLGARAAGESPGGLAADWERVEEIPFDADTRRMVTVHRGGGTVHQVTAKGAPEAILPLCEDLSPACRESWADRNAHMAADGLRVLALATSQSNDRPSDPLKRLRFVGLVGLIDPPRADVPAAISECMEAGIRIVMITGDQAPTATAIARSIGLPAVAVVSGDEFEQLDLSNPADSKAASKLDIIARATPAQKFALVRHLQSRGHVVAMTGDGVNDAPALKQADIGVAMGLRGTDVAREASAMVLLDDAFPSIVVAIRQGRLIFNNIRKFVAYLVSCNLSEIIVVSGALLVMGSLPVLPLQILFLNLVTDVFPALALGVSPAHRELMAERPRPADEPILRRRDWARCTWQAAVIAMATLAAFATAIHVLGLSPERAVTVGFLALAVTQLTQVLNVAEPGARLLRSEVTRNPWGWAAVGLCLALLALACWVPPFAQALSLHPPGFKEIFVIAGAGLVPPFVEALRRMFLSKKRRAAQDRRGSEQDRGGRGQQQLLG